MMFFKRKKRKKEKIRMSVKISARYTMGECPNCHSHITAQIVPAAFTSNSQMKLEAHYAKRGIPAVFVHPDNARDLCGLNAQCIECGMQFIGNKVLLAREPVYDEEEI